MIIGKKFFVDIEGVRTEVSDSVINEIVSAHQDNTQYERLFEKHLKLTDKYVALAEKYIDNVIGNEI